MTAPSNLGSSRTSNALDCALSFISTYFGVPRAAGTISYDAGDPLSPLFGEHGARERAEVVLGRPFEYVGPDSGAYNVIAGRLSQSGHGSAALIVNGWPPHLGSGTHAWNCYHHEGRIGWLDASINAQADNPLYPQPYGVWAILVDSSWRPSQ